MSSYPPDPSGYSNYPRQQMGGGDPYGNPYQRPPGVYFDSISIAWRLVQPNLATWVLTTLVYFLVNAVIEVPAQVLQFMGQGGLDRTGSRDETLLLIGYALSIPGYFLNAVMMGGLLYMGVKQARNERIDVKDLFSGFSRPGALIGGAFLAGICIVLATCLLCVPGLYAIGLLSVVPMLIMDRQMGPVESIQECWNSLRPYAFSLFALVFLAGLVVMVGYCLCLIGLLFTFPIYAVTLGLTYNNFYPAPLANQPYQPIGVEPPR